MSKWKLIFGIIAVFANLSYGKIPTSPAHGLAFKSRIPQPALSRHRVSMDTIRVLALRVQFLKDSLPTSTGDGTFDLNPDASKTIDPPPHNRAYFQSQLLALGNYYHQVSNGKIVISAEVFPTAENQAYQLPKDMRYYSGEAKDELLERRWAELLRDAAQTADQTDAIVFSSYQSVFVFHAGVGNDFAFDFDPTPFDIKSVFLDSLSLVSALGQGISVNGGQHQVFSGLVLPETQSQEGIEIGLLGTMALLFGAQMGLPSLNDTDNQRPGIGRWGLMDQGSANLQGLVPSEPCAWSKVFLGWENPIVVVDGVDLPVAIRSAKNPARIYKIPINANEYFLVENRQRDFDKDGKIVGWDANGNKVELHEDKNTGATRLLYAGNPAVITNWNTGIYDFGLPGSGILIWHIDENIIRANIADNRVNADREHRGVDLVECDGAQDIGYYFGLFSSAAGAENGDFWDPYWSKNESHKTVNESQTVELSPFSIPNSSANDGSGTQIYFFDFSDNDSLMSFSVRSGLRQKGFPRTTGGPAGKSAVLVSNIRIDRPEKMIILGKQNGEILAWRGDGTALLASSSSGQNIPDGFFAHSGSPLAANVGVAQMDDEPDFEIVAPAGRMLQAWKTRDQDSDTRADPLFVFEAADDITTDVIMIPLANTQKHQLAFGTRAGDVYLLKWNGLNTDKVFQMSTNGDGITGLALVAPEELQFFATTASGQIIRVDGKNNQLQKLTQAAASTQLPVVLNMRASVVPDFICYLDAGDRGFLQGFLADGTMALSSGSRQNPISAPTGFAAGDLDRDGYPELITVVDGQLLSFEGGAFNFTTNFPITLGPYSSGSSIPIVYDFDNDGLQDALTITPTGQVLAYNGKGKLAAGFPLTVGANVTAVPALADIDSDSDLELLIATEDGYLYVFDLRTPVKDDPYATMQYLGDPLHSGFFKMQPNPIAPDEPLLPGSSVYCYPNPSEDGKVFIRYKLGKNADAVKIKIFDLAGELIDEFVARGQSAYRDHEEVWYGNVESGVYYVRVEANSSGEKSVAFTKVAIVK